MRPNLVGITGMSMDMNALTCLYVCVRAFRRRRKTAKNVAPRRIYVRQDVLDRPRPVFANLEDNRNSITL